MIDGKQKTLKEKRTEIISSCVSQEEVRELMWAAQKHDETVSTYIRQSVRLRLAADRADPKG